MPPSVSCAVFFPSHQWHLFKEAENPYQQKPNQKRKRRNKQPYPNHSLFFPFCPFSPFPPLNLPSIPVTQKKKSRAFCSFGFTEWNGRRRRWRNPQSGRVSASSDQGATSRHRFLHFQLPPMAYSPPLSLSLCFYWFFFFVNFPLL